MRMINKAMFSIGAAAAVLAVAGCGKNGGVAHYGEPFTDAPQVTLEQVLAAPEGFARKTVRVTGVIERQCPVAGCWFFITDGHGRALKVALGDYLPKLPKRLGNRAEVEGEIIRQGETPVFIGTRVTFTPTR